MQALQTCQTSAAALTLQASARGYLGRRTAARLASRDSGFRSRRSWTSWRSCRCVIAPALPIARPAQAVANSRPLLSSATRPAPRPAPCHAGAPHASCDRDSRQLGAALAQRILAGRRRPGHRRSPLSSKGPSPVSRGATRSAATLLLSRSCDGPMLPSARPKRMRPSQGLMPRSLGRVPPCSLAARTATRHLERPVRWQGDSRSGLREDHASRKPGGYHGMSSRRSRGANVRASKRPAASVPRLVSGVGTRRRRAQAHGLPYQRLSELTAAQRRWRHFLVPPPTAQPCSFHTLRGPRTRPTRAALSTRGLQTGVEVNRRLRRRNLSCSAMLAPCKAPPSRWVPRRRGRRPRCAGPLRSSARDTGREDERPPTGLCCAPRPTRISRHCPLLTIAAAGHHAARRLHPPVSLIARTWARARIATQAAPGHLIPEALPEEGSRMMASERLPPTLNHHVAAILSPGTRRRQRRGARRDGATAAQLPLLCPCHPAAATLPPLLIATPTARA